MNSKKFLFSVFLLSTTFGCFAASAGGVQRKKKEIVVEELRHSLLTQSESLMKDWAPQFPGQDETSVGFNAHALAKHLFIKKAEFVVAEAAVINLYNRVQLAPPIGFIKNVLVCAGYSPEQK